MVFLSLPLNLDALENGGREIPHPVLHRVGYPLIRLVFNRHVTTVVPDRSQDGNGIGKEKRSVVCGTGDAEAFGGLVVELHQHRMLVLNERVSIRGEEHFAGSGAANR